ncbi:CPBP family intramembrane glutamate endopeptidase [Bacillus thuringiensis]
MNFIQTNKKEINMLLVFTIFTLLQFGWFILFGLSLLTNSNLADSEFIISAIAFTVPAIIGIILFKKEIIESFAYFKEKTILKIVSVPLVVLFTVIVEQTVMRFLALGQPENQEQLLETGAVILTAAYLISNRSLAYVMAIHMLNNSITFIQLHMS